MSVNVLLDGAHPPVDGVIQQALGSTWPFFVAVREATAACTQDWRHYGKKYGWKLKVHAGGKSLLELTVADGWFLVAMAIREKERQALAADPAATGLASLAAGGIKAAEGYGIRIEVRDRAARDQALALARFIIGQRSIGSR
jgi:hypothetical protein